MNILTFQVIRVHQMVLHALQAPAYRVLNGNPDTAKPGLWLVADRCIYLMSPGLPICSPRKDPDSNLVAYARECDPTGYGDWESAKRALFGEGEFIDWLPVGMFYDLPKTGFVALRKTESQIERFLDENGSV